MRSRLGKTIATLGGAVLLAACGGGGGGSSSGGKVELTFWSWMPTGDQVVAHWNSAHPDIPVSFITQAQGDALVTRLLSAARPATPPELAQAEYQALPTLVSN